MVTQLNDLNDSTNLNNSETMMVHSLDVVSGDDVLACADGNDVIEFHCHSLGCGRSNIATTSLRGTAVSSCRWAAHTADSYP